MKPIPCQTLSIEIDPSIAVHLRVKEPLANIEIRASAIRRCPAIGRLNCCDDTPLDGDVHNQTGPRYVSLDNHCPLQCEGLAQDPFDWKMAPESR